MFKCAKKKLEKENRIVDYIIQTYSEQSVIDGRLLDFINEKAHSEKEKSEMLASLDGYNTLLYESSMFDSFKKLLFGIDKNLLILTHLELSLCFLINTKKYFPEAITDILWIDKERFCQVVQSLESKMVKGGYRLPAGYKAMQPIVHEYYV